MSRHAVTLALLPLENLSGSPEDGRLARGFEQDLITELARFPTLGVIAADSVQAAQADGLNATELARRLGAQFLLRGSVRRHGAALRLSLQMVEGATGRHYWAGRYDEEDLPTLQDEVAARVAAALALQVDQSVLAASRRRPAANLEAYECWLRGLECLQRGTREDDDEGRRYFEQALEIDSGFARAWTGLSMSHFNEWSCQAWHQWEEKERLAYDAACRAESLDPGDAFTQVILARIEQYRRLFDRAAPRLERALQLAPNDAYLLLQLGAGFSCHGELEQGWRLMQRALELNPLCPPWYYCYAAQILYPLRRYQESLEAGLKAPPRMVVDAPAIRAASAAWLGDRRRAAAFLNEFREDFTERIAGGRSVSWDELLRWILHVNPYRREEEVRHLEEGLRRAGLDARAERPAARPEPLPWPVADTFRREGPLWVLSFEHQVAHLPDMRGLHDLARLLARPDEEVACTDLIGATVHQRGIGKADDRALQSYRRRLQQIEEEIGEANRAGRVDAAESLEAERDSLMAELRRATGLAGRTRTSGDSAERARTAIAWRIRHALRKIAEVHPALGRHLRSSVRTGMFCVYRPGRPVDWHL